MNGQLPNSIFERKGSHWLLQKKKKNSLAIWSVRSGTKPRYCEICGTGVIHLAVCVFYRHVEVELSADEIDTW